MGILSFSGLEEFSDSDKVTRATAITPMEALEHSYPQRRRKSGMHLGDILQRAALIIANQDRIEVPAGWCVASYHEIAPLQHAHLLPYRGALARFVPAIAPLGDDASNPCSPLRLIRPATPRAFQSSE